MTHDIVLQDLVYLVFSPLFYSLRSLRSREDPFRKSSVNFPASCFIPFTSQLKNNLLAFSKSNTAYS
ncbi:hypothetical protein VNO77_05201 [Canavalia gladiata]|uniref:Uncharacterized protein n=1 Tax=Canavalia gladiata TaxID=3824 RepID=A0AAN9MYI4_CANGL